jgi:hypothetical protein
VSIEADATAADVAKPLGNGWSVVSRGKALPRAAVPVAVTIASLIAGAIYTWFAGEDVNWDWQNYHEYNVWAVLNGRYDVDVAPAGFQTYFNPAVYFPVYYLRHWLPPPCGLVILGGLHGLNLALIYWLTRVLLPKQASFWPVAAALLIAAVGPMTLSEVGTSFADILTALPVIAGGTLILCADDEHRQRYLFAGLLLGAAVGLKLTNVVYAVGAAAAVLAATRPRLATIYLGIGGALGAVATGGAWSLMLWQEMGNPIFPLFNGVFQSREVMPSNIMDAQFLPRSVWDALGYPFYWLIGDHRSSEHPFRDARFAVATVLMMLAVGARITRRRAIFTRRDVQFIVLFGVSYAAWLGVFSIHRYAIVLELWCAALIVLLLVRIRAGLSNADNSSRQTNALTIAVALAIAAWSQPADWWHRPWSSPYQPRIPEQLAAPATYFLMEKPVAYIAPLLPPLSRFYQLADIALPVLPGGKLDRRIRAGLQNPLPGGAWELHNIGKEVREELLERYKIDRSRPCVLIEGAQPATALEACPLAFK